MNFASNAPHPRSHSVIFTWLLILLVSVLISVAPRNLYAQFASKPKDIWSNDSDELDNICLSALNGSNFNPGKGVLLKPLNLTAVNTIPDTQNVKYQKFKNVGTCLQTGPRIRPLMAGLQSAGNDTSYRTSMLEAYRKHYANAKTEDEVVQWYSDTIYDFYSSEGSINQAGHLQFYSGIQYAARTKPGKIQNEDEIDLFACAMFARPYVTQDMLGDREQFASEFNINTFHQMFEFYTYPRGCMKIDAPMLSISDFKAKTDKLNWKIMNALEKYERELASVQSERERRDSKRDYYESVALNATLKTAALSSGWLISFRALDSLIFSIEARQTLIKYHAGRIWTILKTFGQHVAPHLPKGVSIKFKPFKGKNITQFSSWIKQLALKVKDISIYLGRSSLPAMKKLGLKIRKGITYFAARPVPLSKLRYMSWRSGFLAVGQTALIEIIFGIMAGIELGKAVMNVKYNRDINRTLVNLSELIFAKGISSFSGMSEREKRPFKRAIWSYKLLYRNNLPNFFLSDASKNTGALNKRAPKMGSFGSENIDVSMGRVLKLRTTFTDAMIVLSRKGSPE